jgi:hypothetical protein
MGMTGTSFRAVVLCSMLAAAGAMMAFARATLLVPASDSPISVAGGPGNIVVGDVNLDGRPDLVVASAQSRRVTVLLGHGDGRFAPARQTIALREPPTEMALGEINGDRHLDLALGSHDSYNVTILLGDGRGVFREAPTSPIAMKPGRQPHTHGLAIADFNGDGRLDLVTVNSNDDNDVALALGDGRGGFSHAPGSPFAVGRSPYPLAIGDLNGDGHRDLAVTSTGLGPPPSAGSPGEALVALLGDGRGGFRRSGISLKTPRTWFAAIGDLNGDRKADIVTTHTEDRLLSVLLGDGSGQFAEASGSPFDIGENTWKIALADMNRDRNLDAVLAASTGVRVLLGDGRGGFRPGAGSPFATGKGAWQLAVADVNADDRADVAATNLESNTVSVLLGQ